MTKRLLTLLFAGVLVFAVLQCVRPSIPAPREIHEVQASREATEVLRTSCYSCHSNERRLAWFDEIVPPYWLVRHDILEARAHLNFSTLGSKPVAAQRAALFEAVNMAQLNYMPLSSFLALHPDAKVNPAALGKLKAYLAPWSDTPEAQPDPTDVVAPAQADPEFGGLAFDPSYTSWHLLSATDRGDNGTFRFILGNDIAVKAAREGHTHPWPDGSRFAKVAWQQRQTADGIMAPGKFVQVEQMLKDATKFKASEGWGWGRWKGPKLTPYGTDASLVRECTGCHAPVKRNDYVYTQPISRAVEPGSDGLNNIAASYTDLPVDPSSARPITLYVDRQAGTMSILYASDSPLSQKAGQPVSYPAGAKLLLTTWKQIEDPHWFGARIPGQPVSSELLQLGPAGAVASYRKIDEAAKHDVALDAPAQAQRAQFILRLQPGPYLSH
ncbi:Haem-binding domain-containing protein [Granulicella rosea]|uniref:Haem-binding domain-containing protein n=1 Tax=Granulicella rosea TaxID=474952 RepID=A0A239HX17_9BACT|nr:cytochrome P460 family protein [Granulicella rosea]SNS85822.1 Haem-binding domain-containing protein [Granulicella rosea]